MNDNYSIDDLTADELAELIADNGADVSPKLAAAIRQFVDDIGGIENAMFAIDTLQQLKKAA